MTTTIAIRGVPLEVEYSQTPFGDTLIHEVWICGIEMLCLLDDGIIGKIREEVQRRPANGKEVLP